MTDDALARARAARHWGRYPEALEQLNAALGTRPDAALWLERGYVYLELNDRKQARADFTAASEADPAGAVGDLARTELLHILNPLLPAQNPGPRPKPASRPAPHSWAQTLVVLLLVASIGCATISVIRYGRNPLRSLTPTALPTRSFK